MGTGWVPKTEDLVLGLVARMVDPIAPNLAALRRVSSNFGRAYDADVPAAGIATFKDGSLVRWEDFRKRHLALQAVGLED
jgi:hypothetical protein